jgi:large repetitive protein
MRRLSLSIVVLALSMVSVSIAPQHSAAAPLPAAYSAAAGGDLVALDLDRATGPDLATARLAVSEAKMNGGTSPSSTATASNLAAAVTGLGIAVNSNTQTAPPDHPTPESDTLAAANAPGLLDIEGLTTTLQTRTELPTACSPGGGRIARAEVTAGGATLDPVPLGTIVDTGLAVITGTVAIVPQPVSHPLNRAVEATAFGSINTNSFLNGAVQVAIAGTSTLRAFATGEPGGADVFYNPGTVVVTSGSGTTTLGLGGSATFNAPNGQVEVTVNQPDITESPNGQTATGSVAVVTAVVTVAPGGGPTLATATNDLLPLRASAVAPPGGIDCRPPAPVLNTPTDGSTLTDPTPTFTGTAMPGAQVDILVDGNPIGTTAANGAGNFSFTPGTPIPSGDHQASARARVSGATSVPSNVNDFTILGPPVLDEPADGTVTNDTTPTFTGATLPGAQVDILVDGNPIGTTTANGAGDFSFTPGAPLTPGSHLASARARLNGATSGLSNVNDFAIDIADPAAPTLNSPAEGEVTNDTTPAFTGTAEPRAEVEIFVDGTSIGSTTANGGGAFSFTPATPLAAGPHTAFAGATDAAGNDSPPSNTNAFRIDTDAPAAPVITSPEDGSATTDPTFPIRGTAEPGSQVIIIKDGEEIGSTVADENGEFTFNLPSGLLPVGRYGFSARAVDEAGNSSGPAEPVYVEVRGASADLAADDGPDQSLADTGGPQGWVSLVAVLGVLAGAGILTVTRWRRRGSQPGL